MATNKMRAAVVLSGCGAFDGAEINEAVLTLLELDKNNVEYEIFAPDVEQAEVINHLDNSSLSEKRNVLIEAARIARGNIKSTSSLEVENYSCFLMPGGFGVAKNLSTIATEGANAQVIPEVKKIIVDFLGAKKPIGVMCISPALLGVALKGIESPKLTLGEYNSILEELGIMQSVCKADEVTIDERLRIVSTPAFMLDARLSDIHKGISKLVAKVIELAKDK